MVFVEDAYPNLLFAVDGEVFDMGGLQTIAIGGAYSVDKYYRLMNGWNWWPDEQPTPEMKKGIEKCLDYQHWKVDVVLLTCTLAMPTSSATVTVPLRTRMRRTQR